MSAIIALLCAVGCVVFGTVACLARSDRLGLAAAITASALLGAAFLVAL